MEAADSVSQKNDPLLNLLKSVYVESTDPAAAEVSRGFKCSFVETNNDCILSTLSNSPTVNKLPKLYCDWARKTNCDLTPLHLPVETDVQ